MMFVMMDNVRILSDPVAGQAQEPVAERVPGLAQEPARGQSVQIFAMGPCIVCRSRDRTAIASFHAVLPMIHDALAPARELAVERAPGQARELVVEPELGLGQALVVEQVQEQAFRVRQMQIAPMSAGHVEAVRTRVSEVVTSMDVTPEFVLMRARALKPVILPRVAEQGLARELAQAVAVEPVLALARVAVAGQERELVQVPAVEQELEPVSPPTIAAQMSAVVVIAALLPAVGHASPMGLVRVGSVPV